MNNTYKPGRFSDISNSDLGIKLWEFLNEKENIIRMETACELGKPAVESVARLLIIKFGDQIKSPENHRIKQMIGHMVRQIMEREGFQLDVQNMRVRSGGLFSKGSRYIRSSDYFQGVNNGK